MGAQELLYDDLTQIAGIGPARQRWFAETFGARTYADVAALNADEIEAQLKAEGKPYSRNEIELWPQEAAVLAAEKARSSIPIAAESSVPAHGNSPKEEANANKANSQRNQKRPWRPVATFIVEFQARQTENQAIEQQTKVNFHDTDQQAAWPGIETERIGPWMAEQAADRIKATSRPAFATQPEAALAEPISVTITDLRLYQPAGMEISLASGRNGHPQAGIVRASAPFVVQASVELGERTADILGQREIPYRAQFFTHNRATGDRMHLGDAEPGLFSASKASYLAKLSGIRLPIGTFRLQVVVLADEENVAPACFELPMLRAR